MRFATTPTGPSATCIPARSAGSPSSRSARSIAWCRGCGSAAALYSLRLVEWHFWIATVGILLYITAMWVVGHHAGAHVARLRQSRLPRILLHRDRGGHASLLRDPRARRASCSSPARSSWSTTSGGRSRDRAGRCRGAAAHRRRARAAPRRPSRSAAHALGQASSPREQLILLLVAHPAHGRRSAASSRSRRSSTLETTIEKVEGMRPYSPLELAGRNIYIREGCYLCHSQMIRPFRDEVERYGHYSLAAESMYDHPFQWGSKRTGPDLARVGGKYSDDWHVAHLDRSARGGAGIDHAGLCVPRPARARLRRHRRRTRDAARRRRALIPTR